MAKIKIAKMQDANGDYTIPIDVDVEDIETNAKIKAIEEILDKVMQFIDCNLTEEQKEDVIENYLNGINAYIGNNTKYESYRDNIAYGIYSGELLTELEEKIEEAKQQVYEVRYAVNQTNTVYIKAKNEDEAAEIFDDIISELAGDVDISWEDLELISVREDKYGEKAEYDRNGYIMR